MNSQRVVESPPDAHYDPPPGLDAAIVEGLRAVAATKGFTF